MKVCTKCKIEKSENEFHFRYKNLGIRSCWCKSCAIKVRLEYHKKNRDYEYARDKEHRKEIRSQIDNYLLNHPCVDCGEENIIVLEFDHVRGIKRDDVSRMVRDGLSWKTILLEIEKCEVRCANCHRIVTHERKIRELAQRQSSVLTRQRS